MKESFEDYIGHSPRTRIDIDDIVLRSRRVRRRRKAVAACATGLAVVGVTVLSVVILPGGGGRSAPVSTPAPTASPTPQVSEHDRLFAAVKAAITREAPQVTNLDGLRRHVLQCRAGSSAGHDYVLAGPGVEPIPCPAPPGMPPEDLHRSYLWRGLLTSPTGTYHVHISISRTVHFDPAAAPLNALEAEERRIAAEQGEAPERGPNGENILVRNYLLNMSKPDGTRVFIMTWDTIEEGAYGTRGPFTKEQLKAIGLDPLLHL